MRKTLFFIFCGLLVAVLTVFLTAQHSAYSSNKVESIVKDSFSSPAASESYLSFGKISGLQSPSVVAKTILARSNGSMGIEQYRSTSCTTRCTSGCTVTCTAMCTVKCSDNCR